MTPVPLRLPQTTLLHYPRTPETFTYDPDRTYPSPGDPDHRIDKPSGLWVSVPGPDDWLAWNRSEEFLNIDPADAHVVTLTRDANVLHLATEQAVRDLCSTYPHPEYTEGYRCPDWAAIREAYDGIVIAPYQWGCRYDVSWYYGWDCASGCIWNLDAIESVHRV